MKQRKTLTSGESKGYRKEREKERVLGINLWNQHVITREKLIQESLGLEMKREDSCI